MFNSEAELGAWFKRSVERGRWRKLLGGSYGVEFKLVKKGTRLARSKVPEHQVLALWRACGEMVAGEDVVAHKISDSAIGYKPFDFVVLRSGGWLVVGFAEVGEVYAVAGSLFGEWYVGVERGSVDTDWFKDKGVVLFGQ